MSSFKIGNVFGIPVRIHATFLLLVYGVWLFSDSPLFVLGAFLTTFACVLRMTSRSVPAALTNWGKAIARTSEAAVIGA